MSLNVNKGFTLIEIMVVVVIIGLLAAIVTPQINDMLLRAKREKIIADFANIETALKIYNLDNSMFPTSEQGLDALVSEPVVQPQPHAWKRGGYLSTLPLDPWENPYRYESPVEGHFYDIYTLGADDVSGGVDQAADLSVWDN